MMHNHSSKSKQEIAIHASLPFVLMLFIEMALNFYSAPRNSIFISPYLLSFFTLGLISFIVLWKGEICNGQRKRFTFVLTLLVIFSIGNFLYSVIFTPKHSPAIISNLAAVFLSIIYWRLPKPKEESVYNTMIYCAIGIIAIGFIQYFAIYWFELPSLFNWLRANNFAQILLGILLAGWFLVLAESRLEKFLKILVKLALMVAVLNYIWTAFVLYLLPQQLINYVTVSGYFIIQFCILAMLGWLLLGKNIKNMTAWTIATFMAILYPFINI
ncbi:MULTISPECIES: hypothetical protein [Pasteurellaceae]|uniref:DMT superfamily drug/metabolite transporter n=1 Tax=Pasteurella atlantica TaxID=2827233 RepID=A0AAW8CP80_9PAST|nr:hypothetical protein [Pasteurella atlantica]MBR0573905.1 hypothetical protein [Pasteurella atlantica]MDP8039860.1 hypothetical protein [Pasteurella atlantica]MDP8041980.1 hypothetical protein [Pasteurella atlantica]MDP8044129.1 hypothetical protein [Pasteurella atlantica]MDP8046179.1 hypothetical protein [Pasteurella atlantica]